MGLHIVGNRSGYPFGLTWVTRLDEAVYNTGIEFGILRLKTGERWSETTSEETAVLLMDGRIVVKMGDDSRCWHRASLFDEVPLAAHSCVGTRLVVEALDDCEVAIFRVANQVEFAPSFYDKTINEHRGKGQVDDACLRFVRTIMDKNNSSCNAKLVLGEVITLPGRWSSYPPHHHPQPEIYHYRFTHPDGYGLCELGDNVLRVKTCDTVKIFDGNDHPQTAAPGYGMYYIWAIRHLPGCPYTVPEFTPEHAWIGKPGASFWFPKELLKLPGNRV